MHARTADTPIAARAGPLRVLVVDDSAVVRQALAAILSRAGMAVAVAADPVIATEKMRRERPDAIVLDLEMPRMDGLTFLRELMARDPLPVVVCSGAVGEAGGAALQALEEGAVEIIAKPRLGVKGFLEESAARLVDAVRAAAQARVRRPRAAHAGAPPAAGPTPVRRAIAPAAARPPKLVAVGASTGGPEAIRAILERLPPDAPPLVVVQHMPEPFTAAFARRLAGICRVEVREARDGDRVRAGLALVAPGNHHVAVRRGGGQLRVDVVDGPLVSGHRPSVDVLFRSVARAAGAGAVGVLLTGMGDDGAEGLCEMRAAGAHTIAQDEDTSVVFGMPGEAIARGAAAEVLPLGLVATAILERAR
ncbi:MAG TPA: chemotaxis-specific protein-glutamate methyltransferase CheB [Anaeromyxobacter sp.]|nr:chemotaxis-specific protein-glutamate methyltransferase CheB [Anaeromyxobacter sp.]